MRTRDSELSRPAAEATSPEDARLARALRNLPAVEPPPDGWERLERRLAAPRTQVGPVWPTLAVAASALLLAVGLLLRAGDEPGSRPEAPATASAAASTAGAAGPGSSIGSAEDWRRRSLELERLLAALPEPRVTRASTGFTAALLEDRIALIDERLNEGVAAARGTADVEALLRQRALLLDSLASVRYAAAVDPAI
ncbi:MAG: hypothetical protein O9284_13635 [Steroidobacteraceae bacterium]|nr:hypothetical protein [Steroidobacteraceae bacterium]